MSELDEMREELFKLLYPYADVKSGYGYALIEQILSLSTDKLRIAVVRNFITPPQPLPEFDCMGYFIAQDDMVAAGYVQEVKEMEN